MTGYFFNCEAHTFTYSTSHIYAPGDIDVDTASSELVGGGNDPSGTALLGFFNSAIVTPDNLVIPTTGGSPFFTNSYMPARRSVPYSIMTDVGPTRHLVPSYPESVPCNLFVDISLQFEYDLADCNSRRPMIK